MSSPSAPDEPEPMTAAQRPAPAPLAFWLAIALTLASPAPAERLDEGLYDVHLGGFRVGLVALTGYQNATRYRAEARIESAGLAGLVRRVRYDALSEGAVVAGRFTPLRYEEDADTGRRQSRSVMEYEGGVPRIVHYESNRDAGDRGAPLDPASQGGTLDPMTALYLMLRDATGGEICRLAFEMFDGRRRSRVQFDAAAAAPGEDGSLTCPGEYRRIEGFALRDMGEMQVFPFEVTYDPPAGGQRRVKRVRIETLYGTAVLLRR